MFFLGQRLHYLTPACFSLRTHRFEDSGQVFNLGSGQLELQFAPGIRQGQKFYPPVIGCCLSRDKLHPDKLSNRPVEGLLGLPEDFQQAVNRRPGISADEIKDPVVNPSQPYFFKNFVRTGREGPVCEIEKFNRSEIFGSLI